MNDPHVPEDAPFGVSPDEVRSALFAQLVMQQSSMAMMLLGKTVHPESGQVVRDLDAAKLFIDQLEMLEFKTKGNLTAEEAAILKQSLMSLRMAYVDCVNAPSTPTRPQPEQGASPAGGEPAAKPTPPIAAPATGPGDAESHKKFTKKY